MNKTKKCPNCGNKTLRLILSEWTCMECEYHSKNRQRKLINLSDRNIFFLVTFFTTHLFNSNFSYFIRFYQTVNKIPVYVLHECFYVYLLSCSKVYEVSMFIHIHYE